MAPSVIDASPSGPSRGRASVFRWVAGLVVSTVLLGGGVAPLPPAARSSQAALRPAARGASLDRLRAEHHRLERARARLTPRGPYIVVDTAQNLLYLKSGDRVIHQAVASTGSGRVLVYPTGNRRWVFDTPRGVFKVQSRLVDPVWVKPDWAFIEDGQPIPGDPTARLEPGVLGEYALGFGDGYFIHGTLYTRLLGQNVTHGCIRLADEDLRKIYHAAPRGTAVFIY